MRLLHRLIGLLLVGLFLAPAPALAAYSCTVSRTRQTIDGRAYLVVTLAETQARDTSECTVPGLPVWGTIWSYKATLTAGTGTTINPVVGNAAAFVVSTQGWVTTADTTAAHVNEQTPVVYASSTGTLYVRSTPNNAATNHSISTEILIRDGAP